MLRGCHGHTVQTFCTDSVGRLPGRECVVQHRRPGRRQDQHRPAIRHRLPDSRCSARPESHRKTRQGAGHRHQGRLEQHLRGHRDERSITYRIPRRGVRRCAADAHRVGSHQRQTERQSHRRAGFDAQLFADQQPEHQNAQGLHRQGPDCRAGCRRGLPVTHLADRNRQGIR
ncbi:hypothetical protein D3C81_1774750 [compost metagenome]